MNNVEMIINFQGGSFMREKEEGSVVEISDKDLKKAGSLLTLIKMSYLGTDPEMGDKILGIIGAFVDLYKVTNDKFEKK